MNVEYTTFTNEANFPHNFDGMGIETIEVAGLNVALAAMRNPMNSWDKCDSYYGFNASSDDYVVIGENDMKLNKSLIAAGPADYKHLRMIHVYANVNMPRYYFSELDTYHFNTKVSCSTMHKLLNNVNPITKDMFVTCEEDDDVLIPIIDRLESLRIAYKDIQHNCTDETKADKLNHLLLRAKRLLPEGFLQMRTIDTNYAELRTIYHQRKNHRLKEEWVNTFCRWVESLPYAQELIID